MLEYHEVSKTYGTTEAVRNVSLRVERGEICVLLGPSGCGKSTLLRMANRLVEPDLGVVRVDGRDVMSENPVLLRRRIGYVIQSVGLLPHWTVAENVALTPGLLGMKRTDIEGRVDEMLDLVRLDPATYRDRYPAELSGGEAQRVGVARALAAHPALVIMDEPFGAVDPINRQAIRSDFVTLHRSLGGTVLFVSHDVAEAVAIADRIALMNNGSIVIHDTPANVLASDHPMVAGFFGNPDELLLDVLCVADALVPPTGVETGHAFLRIDREASLRTALIHLLRDRQPELLVAGDDGATIGRVTLESISGCLAATERRDT